MIYLSLYSGYLLNVMECFKNLFINLLIFLFLGVIFVDWGSKYLESGGSVNVYN